MLPTRPGLPCFAERRGDMVSAAHRRGIEMHARIISLLGALLLLAACSSPPPETPPPGPPGPPGGGDRLDEHCPGIATGPRGKRRRPRLLRLRPIGYHAGSAADPGPAGRLAAALSECHRDDRRPLRRARHARIQSRARRAPRSSGQERACRIGNFRIPGLDDQLWQRTPDCRRLERGGLGSEPCGHHHCQLSFLNRRASDR